MEAGAERAIAGEHGGNRDCDLRLPSLAMAGAKRCKPVPSREEGTLTKGRETIISERGRAVSGRALALDLRIQTSGMCEGLKM
jgi:hypothetical protein